MDVDSFIGVKSHRAKGKRISTYDIASLRFIEPEIVEEPNSDEPQTEGEEVTDMEDIDFESAPQLPTEDAVESTINVEPSADEDFMVIDSEQLNLF